MGTGEPQALHVKRLSQRKTKRRRWLSRTEIYEPRPMDEDGENLQKNIRILYMNLQLQLIMTPMRRICYINLQLQSMMTPMRRIHYINLHLQSMMRQICYINLALRSMMLGMT